MNKFIFLILATFSVTMFCGCSEEQDVPPLSLERTNLIQRLFVSLDKGDRSAAVSQAEKLQKMMPDNAFGSHVLETLTANTYIIHAQKAIDEGHEPLALEILAQGLRKHPMNRILIKEYNNLKTVCDIENALKKGEFAVVPLNLYAVPVYGPRLIKKMQLKNIPIERKD